MTCRALLAGALRSDRIGPSDGHLHDAWKPAMVPIDRLVANLERELKTDPANVQTIINLARLHAMAFALKIDEFPAAQ